MLIIQPPPIDARVCLKSRPHLQGYVKSICERTYVVSIPRPDVGVGVYQDARVHDVSIQWDDPEKVSIEYSPNVDVSSISLKVINQNPPKDTLEALRQMVRRRKKAMGNEAFLKDEVLQEVDRIFKGKC
jgi:hypothetical protein